MSDNVEVKSGEGEGLGAAPEPQFTEIEQRAAEQGWRPQDEWDGEPDDWRTAREFLDRGEFFKKIDEQNRTIKELRKTQTDFAKHLDTRSKKTEFNVHWNFKSTEEGCSRKRRCGKSLRLMMRLSRLRQAQLVESQQAAAQHLSLILNSILFLCLGSSVIRGMNTNTAMRAYADTTRNQMNGMSPN
jgi:hypothetical protein